MNDIPRIDPEFESMMPPLSDEEFDQLEQNILSHKKCRDAIVIWNGVIIDGHNRFKICVKHGIEFEISEMRFETREDAKMWIINNQLGRRNLTDVSRIELALHIEKILREKARKSRALSEKRRSKPGIFLLESSKPGIDPINMRKELANIADVSEDKILKYKYILKNGSPELIDKVRKKEIKIDRAYRELKDEQTFEKTLLNQITGISDIYISLNAYLPFRDKPEVNREIMKYYERLSVKLDDLIKRSGGNHEN